MLHTPADMYICLGGFLRAGLPSLDDGAVMTTNGVTIAVSQSAQSQHASAMQALGHDWWQHLAADQAAEPSIDALFFSPGTEHA